MANDVTNPDWMKNRQRSTTIPRVGQKPKTTKTSSTARSTTKKPQIAPIAKPGNAQGLGALFEGAGNGIADALRQGSNFVGSAADFLLSKEQAPKGGGIGDFQYGRRPEDKLSSRARPGGGSFAVEDEGTEEQAMAESPLSLLDFLKQAQGMVPGGTDYSAQIGAAKSRAGESDAKLEAMYRQLQQSFADDAPGIQQNYDAGGKDLSAQNQEAQQQVGQAYQAARNQQTEQLQKLGIGDAAGVLAAQGGNAANDQAAAQANIEQNTQAAQAQNTTNRGSSIQYNNAAGQAAGLEGTNQRARVQAELAQTLAKLTDAQQSQGAEKFGSALSLAQVLKQEQDERLGAQGAGAQQQFENELAADQQRLAWTKAQGSGATLDSYSKDLAGFNKIATDMGIPEDQFLELFKLYMQK